MHRKVPVADPATFSALLLQESEYTVIRVPRYITGVDLDEMTDLCREGAGGLYDCLLPHQKNTVRGMFCQAANRWTNGLILADQTGLGKLVQCVALAAAVETYCHEVAGKTDFSGVLFVFPTAIYDAQLAELHEWVSMIDRKISIKEVKNKAGNLALLPGPRGKPRYGTWVVLKETCAEYVLPGALQVHKYCMVVKDESHDMRNMKCTSRAVAQVAQHAYFSALATATPTINAVGDLEVIAPILYEDPDEKTWEDIVDEAMWRTVRAAGQETFKVNTMTAEPSAAQRAVQSWLAEEQEAVASDKKIGLTSYMRLAAIGLPVLLYHVEEARLKASGALIPKTRAAQEDWLRAMGFQVDPAASAVEHRALFWNSFAEVYHNQRARNGRRMLLDGLEKSLGFDVSAFSALDGKNAKIVNMCMHLLDEDPSSAVIIFVQYHSELEVLAEALRLRLPAEDKDAVVTYHGALQQNQKSARLGLLKSGKVQVFLATLASAGTGLNFQDVSYRVLFSTPSYVPAEELQGIGRVVRHGQEMPVKIYRFLMEPCDVRAMAIQFKKMRVMEDTHGGYGDLAHMLLGDAVHDEKMLQDLAAEPSGTAAEPTGEAEDEDEDEPPSKRSKGKGKAR